MKFGDMLRDLVGGRFDIICFDPRGIGRSTPTVNCFGPRYPRSARAAQREVLSGTVLDKIFDVPPDPSSKEGKAVMVHQQKEALSLMQLQGELCAETMGAETLKWMGTTTLIKDMEYLKNAIDGAEALINFHGGSYGTIVGKLIPLPQRVALADTWLFFSADYLVNM